MSRAFALVKFKKSGNIYYGCYDGTMDVMNPFLCTPQECYDKEHDCYKAISYCNELNNTKNWKIRDNITVLDDIEIYSDYGGGFYWDGTGNEPEKMIKDFLAPFDQCPEDIKDGHPEWVEEFLHQILEI